MPGKSIQLNKKVTLIASIAVAILVIILLVLLISPSKVFVPEEFSAGRQEAAEASLEISELFNQSISNLSVIARYEREERFPEALELLHSELSKSPQRNQAALKLANAIDQMAQSSDFISPRKARTEAVKAVSAQVAAITNVLAYNDLFNLLFQNIQAKINGASINKEEIDRQLDSLNRWSKQVNELNKEFARALEEFDSITKMQ